MKIENKNELVRYLSFVSSEGLAATLQACVVARFNEDYDERNKRNEIPNGNHPNRHTPTPIIKTEGKIVAKEYGKLSSVD